MIKNNSSFALKILPFAFAIHNFEEAWCISNDIYGAQSPFVITPAQFIVAVSLFTVLGFLLVFGQRFFRDDRHYKLSVIGFAGMLFLNSFFPHILSAIYFVRYTPGLITSSLMILPLTTHVLWRAYKSQLFSNKQLVSTILFGGIIGAVMVCIFLGIGYIFTA